MKTVIYASNCYDKLCDDLLNDKVVGFPTDTVYGLAISSYSSKAFDALVAIKNRPITKPISVMVDSIDKIKELAILDNRKLKMLEALLPGPVTFLLKAKDNLPYHMTLGYSTIGIRIPNHPTSLAILKKVNVPLLVTSANLSGEEPLLKANDVYNKFNDKLASLIAEDSLGNQASTIIDLSNDKPVIVRDGPISHQEVMTIWEESK